MKKMTIVLSTLLISTVLSACGNTQTFESNNNENIESSKIIKKELNLDIVNELNIKEDVNLLAFF